MEEEYQQETQDCAGDVENDLLNAGVSGYECWGVLSTNPWSLQFIYRANVKDRIIQLLSLLNYFIKISRVPFYFSSITITLYDKGADPIID